MGQALILYCFDYLARTSTHTALFWLPGWDNHSHCTFQTTWLEQALILYCLRLPGWDNHSHCTFQTTWLEQALILYCLSLPGWDKQSYGTFQTTLLGPALLLYFFRLPGWDKHSYGYHGDDGHSFCSSGQGQKYGPTFTTGDVIGQYRIILSWWSVPCLYSKINETEREFFLLKNLFVQKLTKIGKVLKENPHCFYKPFPLFCTAWIQRWPILAVIKLHKYQSRD